MTELCQKIETQHFATVRMLGDLVSLNASLQSAVFAERYQSSSEASLGSTGSHIIPTIALTPAVPVAGQVTGINEDPRPTTARALQPTSLCMKRTLDSLLEDVEMDGRSAKRIRTATGSCDVQCEVQ